MKIMIMMMMMMMMVMMMIMMVITISIFKHDDVDISRHLIGSLSLVNGQCQPLGRGIIFGVKQWPA